MCSPEGQRQQLFHRFLLMLSLDWKRSWHYASGCGIGSKQFVPRKNEISQFAYEPIKKQAGIRRKPVAVNLRPSAGESASQRCRCGTRLPSRNDNAVVDEFPESVRTVRCPRLPAHDWDTLTVWLPIQTSLRAIVGGCGHHGLTAAAYLAREGRSTRVSTPTYGRRLCVTEEIGPPGCGVSTTSYIASMLRAKVISDLIKLGLLSGAGADARLWQASADPQ